MTYVEKMDNAVAEASPARLRTALYMHEKAEAELVSAIKNLYTTPLNCAICDAWLGKIYAPMGYCATNPRPTTYCPGCVNRAMDAIEAGK